MDGAQKCNRVELKCEKVRGSEREIEKPEIAQSNLDTRRLDVLDFRCRSDVIDLCIRVSLTKISPAFSKKDFKLTVERSV